MQQRLMPVDDDGDDKKGPRKGDGPKVYTVSEITGLIKSILSRDPKLRAIHMVGELFEVSRPRSGHIYFKLKDESAVIPCVMWRNQAQKLKFQLEEGLRLLARGSITVYERGGKYQLDVVGLRPEGMGALHLAFEQLRKKLKAEGLFAEERKSPIPRFPKTVGVVTSPTGAAIMDIIRVARERWPMTHIVLAPATVQGDASSKEIVEAIQLLNTLPEIGVMIVGRGGGSLEDLWSFNEEAVARAIVASDVPVVTGIGHEVDRTIADFVSDKAAATPSQAAELVFPNAKEIRKRLVSIISRIGSNLRRLVLHRKERLRMLMASRALARPKELIKEYRQVVDDISDSMARALQSLLEKKRHALSISHGKLGTLNPKAILGRGYSITLDQRGTVVKESTGVEIGEEVKIILHKGEIKGRVESRQDGKEDGEEIE